MTNLLEETLEDITRSGHEVADITFIGSEDGRYSCTWDEFRTMADVEYYSGYGSAQVAPDLVIRFSDGKHLWRAEYDGSEWWTFVSPAPTFDGTPQKITAIIGDLWQSISELNREQVSE